MVAYAVHTRIHTINFNVFYTLTQLINCCHAIESTQSIPSPYLSLSYIEFT